MVGAGFAQSFAANLPSSFDGDLLRVCAHVAPSVVPVAGAAVLAHSADHTDGPRDGSLPNGALLPRGRLAALFSARADADRHHGRVHPHPFGDLFQARFVRYRHRRAAGGFRGAAGAAGGGLVAVESVAGSGAPQRFDFRQSVIAAVVRADRVSGSAPRRTSICIRWRARPGWDCSRRR